MSAIPYPRLGIRTGGTEVRFLDLILAQARAKPTFSLFELGTAEGFTLSGIWRWLTDHGLAAQSIIVSSDLPNGWSRNDAKLANNLNSVSPSQWSEHREASVAPAPGRAQVYYVDGRVLIRSLNASFGFAPDFTFIDGCHGRACVMADFEAVAPTVPVGGLVCFHDACPASQHTDFQDHCRERINVRKAIYDLGLLDGRCPGWELAEEIASDRPRGGEGNGHVVVRRVA